MMMLPPELKGISKASGAYLSAAEELHIAELVRSGDARALDKLVRAHIRLVFGVAREFENYGLPKADIVSEGLLGLVDAARRFDPSHGVRFGAYARLWARMRMRRYTLNNRRITRMPTSRNGRRLLAGLRKTQRDLANSTGSWPETATVAEVLGVSVRDVEEVETALSGRDLSHGTDAEHGEFELPMVGASPEEIVADREDIDRTAVVIGAAMRLLTLRERLVVHHRFLIDEPVSLAAVGAMLGVSREWARTLQKTALAKLRAHVERPVRRTELLTKHQCSVSSPPPKPEPVIVAPPPAPPPVELSATQKYNRTWWQSQKAKGLCICGRPAREGLATCGACKMSPEQIAEYRRRVLERGCCPNHPRTPVVAGAANCAVCIDKRRRQAKRRRGDLKSAGLCQICGNERAVGSRCKHCKDKRRQW